MSIDVRNKTRGLGIALVIVIVVGILYGVKSDLESAELYKAEVDRDPDE